MGINGLLPLLKSIQKSCSLKSFEGKTLGVDAYGWLHRGVVACAMELAIGKPSRKFVDFAMNRVRMLQHFGVTPYLVFDGDYLPSKAATEADRAKRREQSRRAGFSLLNAGKASQAHLEFQKSLDVTPEMAQQLIEELKNNGVKYIVAPYEADPQMVYLERKGIIDGIISEDSDLLVFGAKCLLTKLDQYGNCIEVNKADFSACKDINMTGWSDVTFRQMAILSGCDYLASINKMGLKTAYRMMWKYKTIEKVVQMLQFDGKFQVPKNYLESFRQAELTFLHQRVFCPQILGLVCHTQPLQPIDVEQMPFIGAYLEPQVAVGVARGDLHPMTKLPIGPVIYKYPAPTYPTQRGYQNSTLSSDLSKGVSITNYFKKRTPLAELNPNCFSPSASQRLTLERNTGFWTTNLARQRHRSPKKVAVGYERTDGNSNTPETRPSKRARLCADTEISSYQANELISSPFFHSQSFNPCLPQKDWRYEQTKDEEALPQSDDSIEEAMLSLPISYDYARPDEKSKISVKEIRTHWNEEHLPSSDAHSTKPDPTTTENVNSSAVLSLKKYPYKEDRTSTKSTTPSPSTNRSLDKYRFYEAFASRITTKNPNNKIISTSDQSKLVLAKKTIQSAPKNPPAKSRLTPLQMLSIAASSRSRPPNTSSENKNNLFAKKWTEDSRLEHAFFTKSKEANAPEQKQPKSTSIDFIIRKCLDHESLNLCTGSEDLIIHDSEDEPLSPIE